MRRIVALVIMAVVLFAGGAQSVSFQPDQGPDRVAVLEKQVATLQARVDALEKNQRRLNDWAQRMGQGKPGSNPRGYNY